MNKKEFKSISIICVILLILGLVLDYFYNLDTFMGMLCKLISLLGFIGVAVTVGLSYVSAKSPIKVAIVSFISFVACIILSLLANVFFDIAMLDIYLVLYGGANLVVLIVCAVAIIGEYGNKLFNEDPDDDLSKMI